MCSSVFAVGVGVRCGPGRRRCFGVCMIIIVVDAVAGGRVEAVVLVVVEVVLIWLSF